jgi:molybdate transport system substrate-binding protein
VQRGFAVPAAVGATSGCGRAARQRRTWRALAALVVAMAALPGLGGCGSTAGESPRPGQELRVFAAASLTSTFTAIGDAYRRDHPAVRVTFNFAGSQGLVAQLQQGAAADVLATADEATMGSVADLVGEPRVFVTNSLQIAVAPGNPRGIEGLADLADDDLKVVLAAPEVPAGKYSAEALSAAGVSVDPVSLEDNVKAVVTKVSLGEADAGVVYVTDVIATDGKVEGIDIPAASRGAATYPIAVVIGGEDAAAAQAFMDLVLSPEGQRILRDAGFVPAADG